MLTQAGKPDAALVLAQANWVVQKEPADARLLLQCARAAGQAQAASAVMQFVRERGLVDVRLSKGPSL